MSSDGRIPTAVWIDAHLRQLQVAGKGCYVINKGAYAAGTVLLKINMLGPGCRLMQQQRGMDGELGWMALMRNEVTAESVVDDYIRRAVDRDPDLWVIEVEDKGGINPFEGKTF